MNEDSEEADRGGATAGCRQRGGGATVLFARMVDDPARLELFATVEEQYREQERLFGLIEELMKWENTTNETVMQAVRDEVRESWRPARADNTAHPRTAAPSCSGGAQRRLGGGTGVWLASKYSRKESMPASGVLIALAKALGYSSNT